MATNRSAGLLTKAPPILLKQKGIGLLCELDRTRSAIVDVAARNNRPRSVPPANEHQGRGARRLQRKPGVFTKRRVLSAPWRLARLAEHDVAGFADHRAVAPLLFGAVEGAIGGAQNVLNGCAVLGENSDAER